MDSSEPKSLVVDAWTKAVNDYKASLAAEDAQGILSGGSLQSVIEQINQAKAGRVEGRSKVVFRELGGSIRPMCRCLCAGKPRDCILSMGVHQSSASGGNP